MVINPLNQIQMPEVGVDITLNALEKQSIEMQKAFAARGQGAISLKGLIEVLYPDNSEEVYQEVLKENEAAAMVEQIMQNPMIAQAVQQILVSSDDLEKQQQLNGAVA